MDSNVSDEVFARYLNQIGNATLDQIEAAKAAQAESAQKGVLLSLGEVLVQQGVLTAAIRENVEKKLQAQQTGGIKQLGHYKLIKKLGEGGMGVVYLAEDLNVGRKVAVKVLPKKSDPEFLTRFRREAKAAGALNHVNIVGAYTIGEDQGFHFIAMEYCEGETLDSILKRDKLIPWEAAAGILVQVARGLKHAHDHGFIHRDIKPANIIVCNPPGSAAPGSAGVPPAGDAGKMPALPEGFVAKILDLGLSKNVGAGEQSFATQTGVALGTPHYISPEQARGDKRIDGRTDIYSLGATFYHLVTGMTPFEGSTAAVIMLKHLNEQLINPQDIVEDLPDSVAHVIIRMMAKEPADRYRDCKELLDDLELVIDGKDPSSQAIDHGKSSVAMARVARPRRPVGPVVRKHAKAQQGPVAPREERIGGRKPAKAADPTIMYVGIGGAVFALGIILFLMTGGKTETPSRDPGDPSRDRKGAPSPLADARGSESKVPSAGRPDAGTPVPDTRPLAVQPAFGNQQSDALAALGTEKRAQDALDALLKFEGLAADDKAGRIQRLEAFAKDYGATMVGVRARKMLDELRHEAEAAVANDPERWKNAINLLALVDPKKDAVSGKWEAVDGALRSDATGSHDEHGAARIGIPYRPPTEYDYRIQFTRLSGNDCAAQILSASGRQFLFVAGGFGNTVFGFELIIGKQCDENPTAVRRPACLVNGRRYVLLTQVRSNGVKVYLDGVFLTGYVGGSWQMSVKGEFAIPDSAALGLASWGSPVAFHAVEVLEVTGKGTFTRTSKPAGEVGVAKPDGQPVAPAVAVQPQSAKQEPDTGAVYLSDLQGTEIRGVPGQAQTISVNDVTSAHGFMLHPDRDTKTAHVAYTIGGRFGWLVGSVGVNDSVPDRAEAPLVFKVYGDGKVLWQSRPLQKRAESDAFKVNVTAISKLALSVETAETKWAHAVWIEPRLIPAVDPKLEYEKALAEVYAFLNKNDVKATVARLEQAKADPKLAAMKAALDRDIQCAASMEEIDKAVAAGAALLADKRPFTLKKSDGKETAVGGGTKNTIVGVKDGAVQIEMDLGGGKAASKIPLEQLAPQTRYDLACLGMQPGPEGDLKLAFAALLVLQDSGSQQQTGGAAAGVAALVTADQIRSRLDAARKGKVPAEKVDHVAARLQAWEREIAAQDCAAKIDAEIKAGNWEQAKALYENLKKDYSGTLTLSRAQAGIERGLLEIHPPVFLSDLTETEAVTWPEHGWHFGKKGSLGNTDNSRFSLKGVSCPNGLGMIPPGTSASHVAYILDKKYRTLLATAGIADGSGGRQGCPFVFKVLGDGKALWEARLIGDTGYCPDCRADVTGVQKLELLVENPGAMWGAYAVWGEPRLYFGGGPAKPATGAATPATDAATHAAQAATPAASSKPVTFVAKATEALTKSGFSVEKDKFYKIIVAGSWTNGDGKKAGLVAGIGEKSFEFDAAEGATFQAPAKGELVFHMNDERLDAPKRQGALQVSVGEIPNFKWQPSPSIRLFADIRGNHWEAPHIYDWILTKEGIQMEHVRGGWWLAPPIKINGVSFWPFWDRPGIGLGMAGSKTNIIPVDYVATFLKYSLKVKQIQGAKVVPVQAGPGDKCVFRVEGGGALFEVGP